MTPGPSTAKAPLKLLNVAVPLWRPLVSCLIISSISHMHRYRDNEQWGIRPKQHAMYRLGHGYVAFSYFIYLIYLTYFLFSLATTTTNVLNEWCAEMGSWGQQMIGNRTQMTCSMLFFPIFIYLTSFLFYFSYNNDKCDEWRAEMGTTNDGVLQGLDNTSCVIWALGVSCLCFFISVYLYFYVLQLYYINLNEIMCYFSELGIELSCLLLP